MALNGGGSQWPPVWTSGSIVTYSTSTTGTGYTYVPVTVTTGGGGDGGYCTPAPALKTALDWLDDEIEATCRLARQAA